VLGVGCWVLGALVPGHWCQVSGARCRVPGAGCQVPGATCRVPGVGRRGSGALVPGTRCGIRVAFHTRMIAHRYDELDAWRLSNELKRGVYGLINGSDAKDDRRFCDQLRDSAASAPANLAEGFGYYRHPEFAKHTRIAKASLMESHNHLGDGVDRGFWSAEAAAPLLRLADRAIGACVRLLQHLETSDAPGTEGTSKRRKGTTFPSRERTTRTQQA
jgi:four helix bundle protein